MKNNQTSKSQTFKLKDIDRYSFELYRWDSTVSVAFRDCYCIGVRRLGTQELGYLNSNLKIESRANCCWYTLDKVCEILKRLESVKFCEHCGNPV